MPRNVPTTWYLLQNLLALEFIITILPPLREDRDFISMCVWNCVNIVTPRSSIHCCPGITGEQRPLEGRFSHASCAAVRIVYVTTDPQVGRLCAGVTFVKGA